MRELFRGSVGVVIVEQRAKRGSTRDVVYLAMRLKQRAQALVGDYDGLLAHYDPMATFAPPPDAAFLVRSDNDERRAWFRSGADASRSLVLEAIRSRSLDEAVIRFEAHAKLLIKKAAASFLVAGRCVLFAAESMDIKAETSIQPREKRPSHSDVPVKGRRPTRERRRSFNLEDAAQSPETASRDLCLAALRNAALKAIALSSTVSEDRVLAVPVVDDAFAGALALTRYDDGGGEQPENLDEGDAKTMGALYGIVDAIRAAARYCVPDAGSVYDDPRLPRLSTDFDRPRRADDDPGRAAVEAEARRDTSV